MTTRQPYTRWSAHLPEDHRQGFDDHLKNSTTILERLRDLIDEELKSTLGSEETEKDFGDPNWPYKQAFRNGERAGLKRIRKLLAHIPER